MSSSELGGTPRRSKPSRTSPVGGPLQCSLSTRSQCEASASRIAPTNASRAGQRRSGYVAIRWSYEALHFTVAPSSQSGQWTSVPPRSKTTACGTATLGEVDDASHRSEQDLARDRVADRGDVGCERAVVLEPRGALAHDAPRLL